MTPSSTGPPALELRSIIKEYEQNRVLRSYLTRVLPADVKASMETGHNSHEQILVRLPGRCQNHLAIV